jgi:hypothetical protein
LAQGIRYGVLIFAALALSACGTVFGDDPGEADATGAAEVTGPSGETGQVVEVISAESAPEAGEPQAATPDPAAPQGETLAALPPEPPEPAIDDDPQQLIGMGPASLSAFLGAPELIRREAPASLWQYRAEDCVLDVVLYPDRSGDKVTYLEAREGGATKMAPRTCLNKLLRARNGGAGG